jgi:hypothetical protein
MHIGWVGGILRARDELVLAARTAGHSLEFHMGDTRGRGAAGLEGMVARSDVVIINIEINSHGGALLAKKLARRMGRRSIIVRKPSVSALHRALLELQTAA